MKNWHKQVHTKHLLFFIILYLLFAVEKKHKNILADCFHAHFQRKKKSHTISLSYYKWLDIYLVPEISYANWNQHTHIYTFFRELDDCLNVMTIYFISSKAENSFKKHMHNEQYFEFFFSFFTIVFSYSRRASTRCSWMKR